MNTIEDRLTAALTARADLVQPEDLRSPASRPADRGVAPTHGVPPRGRCLRRRRRGPVPRVRRRQRPARPTAEHADARAHTARRRRGR